MLPDWHHILLKSFLIIKRKKVPKIPYDIYAWNIQFNLLPIKLQSYRQCVPHEMNFIIICVKQIVKSFSFWNILFCHIIRLTIIKSIFTIIVSVVGDCCCCWSVQLKCSSWLFNTMHKYWSLLFTQNVFQSVWQHTVVNKITIRAEWGSKRIKINITAIIWLFVSFSSTSVRISLLFFKFAFSLPFWYYILNMLRQWT